MRNGVFFGETKNFRTVIPSEARDLYLARRLQIPRFARDDRTQ